MAEPAEEPTPPAAETTGSSHGASKRLHSSHSSGMESSVLRFKDVNFIVGKKDKQKNILSDVSGTVKWGHVLAGMFIFSKTETGLFELCSFRLPHTTVTV